MTNGASQKKKMGNSIRVCGSFVALPWMVIDCPNYQKLSANARSLLIEVARQYASGNNGRLLFSRAYLSKRGWNSSDMIAKGKKELIAGNFIYETVKGHRPNMASWYAITWQSINAIDGYDMGALKGFEKGAFIKNTPFTIKGLRPSHGTVEDKIAPPCGTKVNVSRPPCGAIKAISNASSAPQCGHLLELPSLSIVPSK